MTNATGDGAGTTRRQLLALGAGVLGAGCLGGASAGGGADGGTATDTGGAQPPDGSTLADHPVGGDLDVQPRLGPEPGSATATIVAFEDPSCPRCAAFERTTVPEIREKLTEPGRATLVLRTIPVVYPWGRPATHALEATYARDEAATWALAGHYFAEQDAFGPENVLDRTRAFLAAETEVDAEAVVADAEAEAYGDAVQLDLSAGEAADVGGTPTVFLFRDGRYRTRASGSVSYDLIARALEL
jgi:protein-disulfide isomerase